MREEIEKVRSIGIIEGKEVQRDDQIKYFLPTAVKSTFLVRERMMVFEVFQGKKISGGEKNGGGDGVGSIICRKGDNRKRINVKKRERERFI